jgi:hypothetical protein
MIKRGDKNMTRAIRFASIALVQLCFFATPLPAQQQSQCQPADSVSENLVRFVTDLVTSTDPGMASLRSTLGLSGVSPSSISLVSDSKTCKNAAEAFDVLAGTPQSGRKVFVVKAGSSRYVVQAPALGPVDTKVGAFVFDRRFVFIRAVLR